jgi:hypothetical protein
MTRVSIQARPLARSAHSRCTAQLRTCCDFMNLILVYDEFSNASSHEGEVQATVKALMDAMLNPHAPRPKGEWVGVEATRQ